MPRTATRRIHQRHQLAEVRATHRNDGAMSSVNCAVNGIEIRVGCDRRPSVERASRKSAEPISRIDRNSQRASPSLQPPLGMGRFSPPVEPRRRTDRVCNSNRAASDTIPGMRGSSSVGRAPSR
jgi:hypothetical protein